MSAMINSSMSSSSSMHRPRNSCQISVLSSLWDDDNDNSAISKTDDTTLDESTVCAVPEKPTEKPTAAVSPPQNVPTNGPALSDSFQSPTTSIENLRRAAPGVRTRITSLENEVMRSKSPLDKLKEQTRKNNARKLSEEYEAARSKWVRIAGVENPTKANGKPFGLRAMGSNLSIRSVSLEQGAEGLPIPMSEEKFSGSTLESAKKGQELHHGELLVSPIASSCYSVTVPETQTTVIESMRQVSLMSNMSQYNMGDALYDIPSRPGSRAIQSSSSSPLDSTVELPTEVEAEAEAETDITLSSTSKHVPESPKDSPESAPSLEDGRVSRGSSHYSEGSELHESATHETGCRDSGRYSAQWTELTELTIPTIDLDKNEDANRFSLTFPENTEYDPNESCVIHHPRPRSQSMAEPGDVVPESPKKSMLRNMFRRSKSIDRNPAEFRKSWPLAAVSVAQDPTSATKGTLARSASAMVPRHVPDTSMEGHASELAHHHQEPTDASSEHSVYGYMTPSQKAIRILKKVAHPLKWREAREIKKAKAAKAQEAQKNLASGYSLAATPVTFEVPLSPMSAPPNGSTTITLVEALNHRSFTKKDHKKLEKISRRASKLFRKDSKKKKKKNKKDTIVPSSMPSPGLPVIPVSPANEFSLQ